MGKLFFAQKAVVYDKETNSILVIEYSDTTDESTKSRLLGKICLPGGKMEFGEDPDQSLIREVKEETGIICMPRNPLHIANWIIKKGTEDIQIVAAIRLADYVSGLPIQQIIQEQSTTIGKIYWIQLDKLSDKNIMEDEEPGIRELINNFNRYY